MPGGPAAAQALASGDVALAQMAGAAAIQSRLRGSDIVLIAGLINTLTFQFIVPRDVSRPEQLKGKVVGVTRFGSSTDFSVRYALDKWGLVPQRDVSIVELESMPEIFAALKSGRIQGAMLSAPFDFRAKKIGYSVLANLRMLGLEYQHTGIATTESLIRAKPDLVRRIMSAYVEGIHRLKSDRREALAVLAKYLKTNDIEALKESYESVSLALVPEKPYPTVRGIDVMLRELAASEPKAQNARPEQFVDTSFIQKLDRSGFIDRLYKQPLAGAGKAPARTATSQRSLKVRSKTAQEPGGNSASLAALPAGSKRVRAEIRPLAAPEIGLKPVEYTVQLGDNLSLVAERFYGDRRGWGRIYAVNREAVKNPNYIYVGQRISIPPLEIPTTKRDELSTRKIY